MTNKLMDPIGRLMGLRYKSHPWHGVDIGSEAPEFVMSFIEMVPRDTVKYEVDKVSGYLKIDRSQKYSNSVPALYGFIPQTFSGDRVAELSREKTGNPADVEITHVYGREEAMDLIARSIEDYQTHFENLDNLLSSV